MQTAPDLPAAADVQQVVVVHVGQVAAQATSESPHGTA